MLSGPLVALALVGAGFAFGKLGKKPTAGTRSIVFRCAVISACVPFAGLWLAGLLHSDTLGWMAGLSLMFGLPVVLLIGVGLLVGILCRRPAETGPPAQPGQPPARSTSAAVAMAAVATPPSSKLAAAPPGPAATATLLVHINRNSVHASDDAPQQTLVVGSAISLAGLVEQIRRAGLLPGIHGGQATWVIESSGHDESTGHHAGAIGVLAEQWPVAAFTMPSSVRVAEHFAGRTASLFFRYRCQEDPDRVLAQIVGN